MVLIAVLKNPEKMAFHEIKCRLHLEQFAPAVKFVTDAAVSMDTVNGSQIVYNSGRCYKTYLWGNF